MAITINRVLRCLGGAALKSRMSSGYERPFSLSLFARGVWREARGAWRATSCETHRFESGAPRGANMVRRERDQAGPNHFVVRAPMPDLSYCFQIESLECVLFSVSWLVKVDDCVVKRLYHNSRLYCRFPFTSREQQSR